jgi:hypothetical protein
VPLRRASRWEALVYVELLEQYAAEAVPGLATVLIL